MNPINYGTLINTIPDAEIQELVERQNKRPFVAFSIRGIKDSVVEADASKKSVKPYSFHPQSEELFIKILERVNEYAGFKLVGAIDTCEERFHQHVVGVLQFNRWPNRTSLAYAFGMHIDGNLTSDKAYIAIPNTREILIDRNGRLTRTGKQIARLQLHEILHIRLNAEDFTISPGNQLPTIEKINDFCSKYPSPNGPSVMYYYPTNSSSCDAGDPLTDHGNRLTFPPLDRRMIEVYARSLQSPIPLFNPLQPTYPKDQMSWNAVFYSGKTSQWARVSQETCSIFCRLKQGDKRNRLDIEINRIWIKIAPEDVGNLTCQEFLLSIPERLSPTTKPTKNPSTTTKTTSTHTPSTSTSTTSPRPNSTTITYAPSPDSTNRTTTLSLNVNTEFDKALLSGFVGALSMRSLQLMTRLSTQHLLQIKAIDNLTTRSSKLRGYKPLSIRN